MVSIFVELAGRGLAVALGIPIVIPVCIYLAVDGQIKKKRDAANRHISIQNATVYKPLRSKHEIRLIHLLPAPFPSDQIECTSFVAELGKASYEALSYAWGDPRLQSAIKLDGVTFMVTKNLFTALKRLRHDLEPRTLWIDSICINQSDYQERNEQVEQMKDIYENASSVVVWLGEVPKGQEHIQKLFDHSAPLDSKQASILYSKIIKNQWWKRIWVVQELLVSRSVEIQYGGHTISWSQFCHFINRLDKEIPRPWRLDVSKTMIRLRDEHQVHMKNARGPLSDKNELGLLSLAWEFRGREASDARDKLYALLGLVQPEDRVVMPQYSDNRLKVFRNFATSWINHHGSLLIINLSSHQSTGGSRTWYPRWNEYFDNSETLFWNEGLVVDFWKGVSMGVRKVSWNGRFSASGGLRAPNCIHQINKSILHLRGFCHDVVTAVSSTCTEGSSKSGEGWDKWIARWADFACKATKSRMADIEKSFHLTITAGFFDSIPAGEHFDEYKNARNAACHHRRFFVTTKGSFGLGNKDTKIGDNICVLLGSPVPFILRKKTRVVLNTHSEVTSTNRVIRSMAGSEMTGQSYPLWKCVGEAYLGEIMNYKGDLKSDVIDGRLALQDFFLHPQLGRDDFA